MQKRVEGIAKKKTKTKIEQRKCIIFIYIVQCIMYNEFKANKKNCKLQNSSPLKLQNYWLAYDITLETLYIKLSWYTLSQEHVVDLIMPKFMSIGDL